MDLCIKEEQHEGTSWEVCESWIPKKTSCSPRHNQEPAMTSSDIDQTESSHQGFVYDAESPPQQQEPIGGENKDRTYWVKRLKNNDSARRSRMKKKLIEKHMEDQLKELQKENIELKYELAALKRYFSNGITTNRASEYAYPESRCDLSMPNGSVDDNSESSSLNSEDDDGHAGRDFATVAASPLSILTACAAAATTTTATTTTQLRQPSPYILQQTTRLTPFPFKYSFINPSSGGLDLQVPHHSQDEVERGKIPHKFRQKKDFHSAFTRQSEEIL